MDESNALAGEPAPTDSPNADALGPKPAAPAAAETVPGPTPRGAGCGAINASRAWNEVSERVESLLAAWSDVDHPVVDRHRPPMQPPSLSAYLPAEPPALRRLTLIELVKVDLSHRWPHPELRRPIEWYLKEFPDLAPDGSVPCDLIFEEFFIRKRAGEAVDSSEYLRRFPRQAEELGRLLKLDDASGHSTAQVRREPRRELAPGQSLDDFDLLTRVGHGAFATVYLARQRSMQRLVALKVSSDQGNEPQTMAQLDHPHIVRVYDQRLLTSRRLRLLYMQYVPGGTLQTVVDEVCRTPQAERSGKLLYQAVDQSLAQRGESPPESELRGRLSRRVWPEVVCWLGARLAAALDYAHQHGVLHRDLKPANVLVGADGSPKLADFNIAFCSKLPGATPAAYFGGSLAYMSPEQLEAFNPAHAREADELDRTSDVYSLGVLLWELLTGNRPFDDPTPDGDWPTTLGAMTARRRAGVTADSIAALPADCPEGLADILLRCLAADPAERIADAGQLSRQLEQLLQSQVVRLLGRPRGWRRRAAQGCLTAVVLAGLLPNAFASILNITYNRYEIIDKLGTQAMHVFKQQLLIVNLLAYPLGIGVLLSLTLPVLRGVRQRVCGVSPAALAVPASVLRRRCLRLGDMVAWVSAAEWIVSGIVFPIWLSLDATTSANLDRIHYLHFLTSQALCGLPAAMLTFFCVTFLCLRVFYPLLIEPGVPDVSALERLQRLSPWPARYLAASVTLYFISTLAVLLLADTADDRKAMLVLGTVGLPTFWFALMLTKQIERDIAALSIAVSPTQGGE
jgi:serine/threonine protein kinase